jgi:hypothetical protein
MRPLRILCAALLAVPLLALPTPAAADPPPTKILLVGSSTTHGSSGDYTWRYRLWKHLTGHGVNVDFVGPDNHLYDNVHSTSTSFLETDAYVDPAFDRDHEARWGRFLGAFAGQSPGGRQLIGADVTAYQPDYVVVMLGLNDLTWYTTRDPALVAADMGEFIANARAARPTVRLVLVAVQPTKGALTDSVPAASPTTTCGWPASPRRRRRRPRRSPTCRSRPTSSPTRRSAHMTPTTGRTPTHAARSASRPPSPTCCPRRSGWGRRTRSRSTGCRPDRCCRSPCSACPATGR